MLYQSIQCFKVPKGKINIRFFSPSFNDSCVVVYKDNNQPLHLAHIDKQGQILYERPLDKGCTSFQMITNQSIVFLQLKLNRITQINFKDHSTISFQHAFVFSESDSKNIEYFSETRLLCVQQYGNHTQNALKLTYYSYPINQLTKSLAVYESKEKQWEYGNKLKKGDNKNLIIWFKTRHSNYLQFHTFRVRDEQGSYNVYKIQDPSFTALESQRQLTVHDIWQIKDQQFLATCSSPLSYFLLARHEILHITNSSIRLLADTLDIPKNSYVLQRINLGSFTMLSFSVPGTQDEQSKAVTLHIDHEILSTIKIQYDQYDDLNTRPSSIQLDFDHSTYMALAFKQEEGESQIWSIRFTRIMHPREIALHFMLHINEDFDDDLLQDGLELLNLI